MVSMLALLAGASCAIAAPMLALAVESNIRSLLPSTASPSTQSDVISQAAARTLQRTLTAAPMRFEQNLGQVQSNVRFTSRGRGYELYLSDDETVLKLHDRRVRKVNQPRNVSVTQIPSKTVPGNQSVLRMRLIGAHTPSAMTGSKPLHTRVNYLRGANEKQWHRDVPTFARVKANAIYPGIDLVYYGHGAALEYDFVVAAGANPDDILIEFDGANQIEIELSGALVLTTPAANIRLRLPAIYQEVANERREIDGTWVMRGTNRAGFKVGKYDSKLALVIDPVLDFSTYLGGGGSEDGLDNMGVALDAQGNIYVAGTTDSADFPTTGDIQDQFAGTIDAFVAKLDPSGSQLIFATYIGGSSVDSGQAITLDAAGNIYIGGFTDSVDFPIVAPLQAAIGGEFDGFVVKLDPSGSSILYATYIGGDKRDFVLGIDVNTAGEVYVTGDAESENFPVFDALQPVKGGSWDAYAAKLSAAGDAIVFSTFLGGTLLDSGQDIKVDSGGYVHVVGFTVSSDFPTENAFQATSNGDVEAYAVKIEPDGSGFIYSTYLGGESADRIIGLDLDAFGNAYVAGDTFSGDFPAINSIEPFRGFADAFMAKLDSLGNVVFSTFVGGAVADHALAIAVDPSGNAHIAGMTFSQTLSNRHAIQDEIAGEVDAFIASIDASGTRMPFVSYLGGSESDRVLGIAV
ncbi:MAG: hypothetical protein ACI9W2_004370, partial [Gammaproteobacteria bacterium]